MRTPVIIRGLAALVLAAGVAGCATGVGDATARFNPAIDCFGPQPVPDQWSCETYRENAEG